LRFFEDSSAILIGGDVTSVFTCEVEEAEGPVTTVRCHGRLVSSNADQLKDLVKPLIARGGRVLIDFGDLSYMDSSGLGAVVGLKVSSLGKGGQSSLELVDLSPRVRELLSLANLTQLFSVKAYPGTGPAVASHAEAFSSRDDS